MPNSGITTGTPAKIPFGAGVYFQGVAYNEKVAPTAEEIKAAIIGATQEGGTLTITPEFFAPELDGATVAVKELQNKVGETAQMETSFAELTSDLMARMAIGKVGESTDGKYDVITSSEIRAGHFYDGFGYYGKFMDGRPLIILFKQALCTSGFTTDAKNKTNSVFKGTFACMSDIEYGTTKLPYAIFIHKQEGWTAVTPEEITNAA
jgi:hypothetical protein